MPATRMTSRNPTRRHGRGAPPRSAPQQVVPLFPGQGRSDVRAEVRSGVGVVTVSGALDPGTVAGCRAALDRVLRARPADAVVDLAHARCLGESPAVLEAMRCYLARHGVRTWLAAAPEDVLVALSAAGTTRLYRFRPTVDDAVDGAVRLAHLGSGRTALVGVRP